MSAQHQATREPYLAISMVHLRLDHFPIRFVAPYRARTKAGQDLEKDDDFCLANVSGFGTAPDSKSDQPCYVGREIFRLFCITIHALPAESIQRVR